MESRSHALLAGAFTLVLLAAVLLIALVINRDRATLTEYEIISNTAVSGLSAQSPVRYQGVPAGKVQGLSFDPNVPGRVRIRIGVAPSVPITEATWAELGVQGITGLANIDLRDDGSSRVRLERQGDALPVIPLRPGLFERLSLGGGNIVGNLEKISGQLAVLLNDQNLQALQSALRDAATVSASLKDASAQLRPLVAKVGPLIDNLGETSRQAQGAARDISALAQQARVAVARLDAPDGPLVMATRSLREIAYAASRLSNDTLPAVSGMANQVSATARGVSTTVRRVGDTPQSIIFGAPPPRPGPGEAGFEGFGRGQ
ncbi:MlaD family protein [Bordetella genomosp. 11]|uniref:Mammalian cell entry protein n=1 Tax=Bordetella genomosp. 11 TaxID=1416808 RepID=A0A261UMT1_9BORD|nr:MlaD family protein [Bordetella genomosp. 11]OZI62955.1 mammalian cell entry protein [Bordetella genomosp. 11]